MFLTKMINLKSSSVLHIDLEKKDYVVKSYPDLKPLVGGVGIASKIILDELDLDPVVLSVGPLNGFYPFASKVCAAYIKQGKFIDSYGGGRLSLRLRFSSFDAIVLEGQSKEPISVSIANKEASFVGSNVNIESLGAFGKFSRISVERESLKIDGTFSFGSDSDAVSLAEKLKGKNVENIIISASDDYEIENRERYEKQYLDVLGKLNLMLISPGNNPSCSGCPMGCHKSTLGETGGNVLVHSLVSCIYSEEIYSNIPTVFACLNVLGYDYSHEDLENLPGLVYSNLEKIYEKAGGSQLETE
ncbi:hypothetical protein HY419_02125 [candidate division WWE3 bacterium]|nr:hypothetical protein [candidate division WWE3 bacterium]